MDYEAIDRDMSSYVVAYTLRGTRFYITDDNLQSDILGRARRYRWLDEAEQAADIARTDPAWRGWDWRPSSIAAESAAR